jgi:hypothetical protein
VPDPRLAGPADEPALRRLARECPMVGPVAYCLEREPDFFALTRLQGTGAEVAVIDGQEPGTLAAMATRVPVVRRIGGTLRRMSYFADLKVHPHRRDEGHARSLFLLGRERMVRDQTPGYGVVLGGNSALAPILGRGAAGLRFRRIATIRNYAVFSGRRRPLPDGVRVRRATEADPGVLVALWNRVQAARDLAPIWDEAGWLDQVRRTPGLGIERFLIAERAGRPVAFAGCWDARAMKQVRLLGLSPALRWLRRAYNPVAHLRGRPRIPSDGEPIPFAYLTHFCAETAADFRALLSRIQDELASLGCLYLDVSLDARDSLTDALKGMFSTSFELEIYLVTPDAMDPPGLGEGPVYFDASLV